MNNLPKLEFGLRDFNPETDLDFVFASWMKSYWPEVAKWNVDRDNYNLLFCRTVRNHILGNSQTVVAYAPEEPDFFYGWMCSMQGQPVHLYSYVKAKFRRQGIFSAMLLSNQLHEKPVPCWYWTRFLSKINREKPNYLLNLWRNTHGQRQNQDKR